MQREMKRSHRAGFTLVEVIVVLVILAILAAIMIPAMTGWIDKAREKSAIVGCRACVLAAQTVADEQYAVNKNAVDVTSEQVLDLAKVKGTVGTIELSQRAVVEHLVYNAPNGLTVTYCRSRADGHPLTYNFTGGVYVGRTPADIIKKALEGIGATGPSIDSTAGEYKTKTDGTETTEKSLKEQMLAYMKSLGYDMTNSLLANGNIKTWKVAKEGNNQILWWSDVDVSKVQAGDSVRVIRYNESQGTYTAGYMKVATNTVKHADGTTSSYNYLVGISGGAWKETGGQNADTKSSYEETMKIFNGLDEMQ